MTLKFLCPSKYSTTKRSYCYLAAPEELQRVRDLDKAKSSWFQHVNCITQCEDVGDVIFDMVNSDENNYKKKETSKED